MNYTFILLTNTYNPHMAPLAESLFEIYGDSFLYLAYEKINKERLALGWKDEVASYLHYYYESPQFYQNIINESKIVYFGANPHMFNLIKYRVKNNLMTFFHMERILKHGIMQFFHPKYTKYFIEQRIKPSYKTNIYFLACSSYLYDDMKKIGACTKRILKFGYFPKLYLEDRKVDTNYKEIVIFAAGRLIKLKKFDEVIKSFYWVLTNTNESIRLKIAGVGPEEARLKNIVNRYGIAEYVEFLGPLSVFETRKTMLESDIFVAFSDKREGWGAVINEAMNSKCAVIASDQMGAANYLIKNNKTGILIHKNNRKDLERNLKTLIETSNTRYMLAENGYKVMQKLWNSEVAANRLVEMASSIEFGNIKMYEDGPLSLCSGECYEFKCK